MADQITPEEALELVDFEPYPEGWRVKHVNGDVCGNVNGDVWDNVWGDVGGSVCRNVRGHVGGTIGGRQWEFIETPREELKRLIEEGADKAQLLEAFNQLEDN